MASAAVQMQSHSTPSLAVTYEGDDIALLERIVPLVDTIEISPDTIARSDENARPLRPDVLGGVSGPYSLCVNLRSPMASVSPSDPSIIGKKTI